MPNDVAELLHLWRSAERRLEGSTEGTDRASAIEDVIQTWLAYQAAAAGGSGEIIVVADRARHYVAASDNASALFGRDPVGSSIDDVAAEPTDELDRTWDAFASHGSMEGEYEIRNVAGDLVRVRFRAFADVPLPGYFASHMTPVDRQADAANPNGVDAVQRGRTLVATLRSQPL